KPGIKRKIGYLFDTFFENVRLSRKKVFKASYYFINNIGSVEQRAYWCGVEPKTIIQWDEWFRDVLVESFMNNQTPSRIGGRGRIVEIDETYMVQRRYNRGKMVGSSWLIGGIEDGMKRMFVEIVNDRDGPTLDGIMLRNVLPGTTIRTDSWRGYGNLGNIGFVHETVDEGLSFVDPSTGLHSQGNKSTWWQFHQTIMENNIPTVTMWDDHFLEAIWKFQRTEDSRFYHLWRAIAEPFGEVSRDSGDRIPSILLPVPRGSENRIEMRTVDAEEVANSMARRPNVVRFIHQPFKTTTVVRSSSPLRSTPGRIRFVVADKAKASRSVPSSSASATTPETKSDKTESSNQQVHVSPGEDVKPEHGSTSNDNKVSPLHFLFFKFKRNDRPFLVNHVIFCEYGRSRMTGLF
ncbi:hypothetical protein COOONC_05717, partial [Cooperia oncophora]